MSNMLPHSVVKNYKRRRLKKKKFVERLGAEPPKRGRAEETSKDSEDRGEKLTWKISVTVGAWREVSGEDR